MTSGTIQTSSGHFPPIDAAERWGATSFAFLESVQ